MYLLIDLYCTTSFFSFNLTYLCLYTTDDHLHILLLFYLTFFLNSLEDSFFLDSLYCLSVLILKQQFSHLSFFVYLSVWAISKQGL